MAQYTLIKIDQLPDGTANLGSKVMFGIGDKTHTTTVAQMLSLFVENNSITPRQVPVNLLVTSSNFSTILLNVNLTIAQNEIVFLTFNSLFNNRATLNTYLVPLGTGIYNPLGAEISFNGLILINEQPIEDLESDTNTVTYTVTGLNEINDAVVPFDFSDETKVYFVVFDGSLYRFVGDLGLYGDGELQISISDLELISTQANNDFVEKNSFAYLPLSSLEPLPEAPASLNFITTDGDGVTSFSGFQSGSIFIGQRMIIRNDKTSDFQLIRLIPTPPTPPLFFDFTFDRDYIIKAGDNIEFDFTASGFRQVGVDAISRKGTAEGFPIVGDLVLDTENLGLVSIKTNNIDESENIELSFTKDEGLYMFFADDFLQFKEGAFNGTDVSEFQLLNPDYYAQRSYVLGVPKSENFTAETNGRYRTTATLTITDTATENYFVQVQSGVCTIGGVNYVAGDWVWRVGANSYKINGSSGYITANTTAVNNGKYIANGTLTVSDIASPVAGSNYEVVVRGGVVTVGGVAYTNGTTVLRVHNGTDWVTYTYIPNRPAEITLSSNVNASSLVWNDSEVNVNVGITDRIITIDVPTRVVINKIGTGILTIAQGSGRTLILQNSVNQIVGNFAIARIMSNGTNDILNVNDAFDTNFVRLTNIVRQTISATSFTGNPRTATVTISPVFPDANYTVFLETSEFLSGHRITAKTASSFNIAFNQSTALAQPVEVVIYRG